MNVQICDEGHTEWPGAVSCRVPRSLYSNSVDWSTALKSLSGVSIQSGQNATAFPH
jgi:hypothetical protein